MTTAVAVRFRDAFRKYIPPWLADRSTQGVGQSAGFRYLWSMIAPLDAALEVSVQGLYAILGIGTPTALPLIGRTRGLIRGEGESDDDFAAYLRTWLEKWRAAGSADAIAEAIHHYLGNHPRVRIVTRAGYWVTLAADGTITRQQGTWDWDSVSNPERAGNWAEIWVIVYPTEWALRGDDFGGGIVFAGDGFGWGHEVGRIAYDAVRGLLNEWRSAHTKIRTVIWTSDADLFDPSDPGSLPDGTWGTWGSGGSGSRVAGGRDLVSCRYWET